MSFSSEKWPRFVESDEFSRDWKQLGLDDDTHRILEIAIMEGPTAYPVVPGTNGLRKIRFRDPNDNRGKSSSYRACYVYFSNHGVVLLIALFAKNEKANLTLADKKTVARYIRIVENDLIEGRV